MRAPARTVAPRPPAQRLLTSFAYPRVRIQGCSDWRAGTMEIVREVCERGVVERRVGLEDGGETVPGIVWLPEGSTGPRPTVILGHGGVVHKRAPEVLGLARRLVRHQGLRRRGPRRARARRAHHRRGGGPGPAPFGAGAHRPRARRRPAESDGCQPAGRIRRPDGHPCRGAQGVGERPRHHRVHRPPAGLLGVVHGDWHWSPLRGLRTPGQGRRARSGRLGGMRVWAGPSSRRRPARDACRSCSSSSGATS